MKVGMSTHLFAFGQLTEELLELLVEAGFDRIELWGMRPHVDWYDRQQVKRIRNKIRELGLTVASFHLPFYTRFGAPDFRWLTFEMPDPVERKIALDMSRHIVDLCPEFDCTTTVLHGNGMLDRDRERSQASFRRELDEFLPYCESRGVRIALENIITDLSKTTVLRRLVDDYDSEYLWLCLDTGHANINERLPDAVRDCGDRLLTTHIADNLGEQDDHFLPFRGTIDWKETYAAMKAHCPNLESFMFEPLYIRTEVKPDLALFRSVLNEARQAWEKISR